MYSDVIEIDGSYLEGGGQILRNGAALSCITKVPVSIIKIRAGRSNPGLRPQHLMGLQLLKNMCHGKLENGNQGSTEIVLYPENIQGGQYTADTKTAGSICLLIQAALPCQFFASGPTQLLLRGGTNAEMAPQIDYFLQVFDKIMSRFGLSFHCDIRRRGYYPKGGGEALFSCTPVKSIPPIVLTDRGQIVGITGRAFVAGVLPIKVAHTMARTAQDILHHSFTPKIPVKIEAVKESQEEAFGNGAGIMIVAETSTGCRFSGSALGKKGVPAERVAETAAEELLGEMKHNGCVDKYLQDQLIIFMALAKGKSQVTCGEITQHTLTGIHVAEKLTKAKFEIKPVDGKTNLIECEGIGQENNNLCTK